MGQYKSAKMCFNMTKNWLNLINWKLFKKAKYGKFKWIKTLIVSVFKWLKMAKNATIKNIQNKKLIYINITKPKGPTIRMETDFKVVQQTLRLMERQRGEQSAYSHWPSLPQSSSHLSPIPAATAHWSSSPAAVHPALPPVLLSFPPHLL